LQWSCWFVGSHWYTKESVNSIGSSEWMRYAASELGPFFFAGHVVELLRWKPVTPSDICGIEWK
jgi:hypothetical protein